MKLVENLKNKLHYYLMPSLFEVFMVFLFAFHLKFPMESSYLLWQHIVLGKQDIKQHKIVRENPFSYLPSHPLKRSSWLSDDIFYLLFKTGKYKFLIVVKIFILTLLTIVPLFILDSFIYSFLAPIYLLLLMPGASLRPNLFALLIFFFFILAYRFDKPILMGIFILLWSFIHGSYIIGLGLYFINMLQKIKYPRLENEGIKLIAGLAPAMIPLFLPDSSLNIFMKLSSQKYILRTFDEWLSPDFKSFLGIVFFIFVFLWIIAEKRQRNFKNLWPGAFLLYIAFYARRFIPFFAIYAVFSIADGLSPEEEYRGFMHYLFHTARKPFWLVVFFVYFAFQAPGFDSYFNREGHPYGCEKYLNQYPAGTRVFTKQAWVPYLYYATKGKYKFAVDATLSQKDTFIKAYMDFFTYGKGCCKEINVLKPDLVILPLKYRERIESCCNRCLKIEHMDTICMVGKVIY